MKGKIPTIIGVFLLIGGLAAGVLLIQNKQIFKLGASADVTPQDVRITNVTDTSFSVSWTTDKPAGGFISYSSDNAFNKTAQDQVTPQSETHYVNVTGLTAQTAYNFKINSGGQDYDNNGNPWQVQTGAQLSQPSQSNIISGQVLTASGNPATNALVYINVASASPLSTITSQTGTWLLSLSSARTQDLSSYASINDTNSVIEISVQAGTLGIASAKIYPQSAKPVPQMVLGKQDDFRNLPPSSEGDSPKASVGLPTSSTPSSSFNVNESPPPKTEDTVTLKSLNNGEVISTDKPEFFGDGPPGTKITITVESDPITTTQTVASSGSWNWSPPSNLAPGSHTITISWRDAGGILRTLTRTFVVQASEGPSFESTPSASLTPSPSPTASPSPSPIPSLSPSPSASASPLPSTGSLIPTYTLFIMGIGMLLISGIAAVFAFKEE
jgi:hypothetical protein